MDLISSPYDKLASGAPGSKAIRFYYRPATNEEMAGAPAELSSGFPYMANPAPEKKKMVLLGTKNILSITMVCRLPKINPSPNNILFLSV